MRNSENKDFSQWGWGSLAGRKLEDSGTTSLLKGKQKPVNLEFYCKNIFQKMSKMKVRVSLVVQWLRIFLSMQGTQVWCLVLKDPTCHEALKLLHHNYWSPWTQDPMLHNKRSHCSEKPMHCNERVALSLLQLQKAQGQQWRPSAAKNKINKNLFLKWRWNKDLFRYTKAKGICHL